jgi:hypothetical protein
MEKGWFIDNLMENFIKNLSYLSAKKEPIRVHIAKQKKIKRKSNSDDHSHSNKKDSDDVIFLIFIKAPKSSS